MLLGHSLAEQVCYLGGGEMAEAVGVQSMRVGEEVCQPLVLRPQQRDGFGEQFASVGFLVA